ncbi:MAG: putative Ig domain-containing protein [Gemmatimonadota bacterium]|nr:putative Ig domain-containing protein [Gemmatimonadota bacterium]
MTVSDPVPSLTIASISDVTVTQNAAITAIQVSASGGQTPYTYSISDAPSGIAIHSSSGSITGTPTKAGTFNVTVTVTDAHGRTGKRNFSMTVNASTLVSALTVAEISDISVKISAVQTNDPITPIQVSASGGQTPYEYALSSTPATGYGLTIGSSSRRITGTPTKAGTFTLTVKVTDKANKTATESFSMAVSLIGDFNGDGVVNLSDHSLFVAAFGLSEGEAGYNAEMDLNGDGTINTADFVIFVSHFPNADQFF